MRQKSTHNCQRRIVSSVDDTVKIEFDSYQALSNHRKRHHIHVKWFELVGRNLKLLNIHIFF